MLKKKISLTIGNGKTMKKKSNFKNQKFRTIELVLWTITDSYDTWDIISLLEDFCFVNGYRYYYLNHDKDVDDNGEPKKEHIHFIIYTTRDKECTTKQLFSYLNWFDEDGNIPSFAQFRIKNNIRESVKYLTHSSNNSTNKYHYDWMAIQTNDTPYVERVFSEDMESASILLIIRYIDDREDFVKVREVVQMVLDKDIWSVYRRNASIVKSLLDEHNFKLMKKDID